jgi:hypothetical protein
MPDGIKTYVLVGDENNGQFDENGDGVNEECYAIYKNRSDCIIIRPQRGQSLEDAIKTIQPPANIILQAHGGPEGTFTWSQEESLPYSRLMRALPRNGILSLTLGSCYGGTAQATDILKDAPPGMLVQSMIGPRTGDGNTVTKFAEETVGLKNPIDLFLEALDNFNPVEYKKYIEYWNREKNRNSDPNPEQAMPHIIGLGNSDGIDLQREIGQFNRIPHDAAFHAAMQRAVTRVQQRFDTDYYRMYNEGHYYIEDGSLGRGPEISLDQRIATMAQRLAAGYQPRRVEEKRLAYAITAAYLDESGELERRRERIPGYVPLTKYDANGNVIDPNILQAALLISHRTHANITAKEQAYIDSVWTRLNHHPELCLSSQKIEEVVTHLGQALSQTYTNDVIGESLADELRQLHISTRGWAGTPKPKER